MDMVDTNGNTRNHCRQQRDESSSRLVRMYRSRPGSTEGPDHLNESRQNAEEVQGEIELGEALRTFDFSDKISHPPAILDPQFGRDVMIVQGFDDWFDKPFRADGVVDQMDDHAR